MNTNTTNNSTKATTNNRNLRRRPEMVKDIITTIPNKTIDNFSDSNIISDVTSVTSLKKLIEVATERLNRITKPMHWEDVVASFENADFPVFDRIMIALSGMPDRSITDMYNVIKLYATVRINIELNKAKNSYDVDTYMETFRDAFLEVTTSYNFEILVKIFKEAVEGKGYYDPNLIDINFDNPFTIYMFSDFNDRTVYRDHLKNFWFDLVERYNGENGDKKVFNI